MSESSSPPFVSCRHAVSRRAGVVEYLERCPQQTEIFNEILSPQLAATLQEATAFVNRYDETVDAEDLNAAGKLISSAYQDMEDGHPHLAATLSSYEAIQETLVVETGIIRSTLLDTTIKIAERAVDATSTGHPCRATRLSNLSNWEGRRFEWHSYTADLDTAIENAELAVLCTASNGTLRAGLCNNLGYWLSRRFDLGHDPRDIDRAVRMTEEAVIITPQGDPLLAARQNNLAVRLHTRFVQSCERDDIGPAIDLANMAVQHPGVVGMDRSLLSVNLGNLYIARFEKARLPRRTDIDHAISHFHRAVRESSATGSPDHADYLLSLGVGLMKRHATETAREHDDMERSLSAFQRGWACPRGRTETRIHLARRAANILALKKDWKACSALLEEAVGLLHFVSLPLQMESTRQDISSQFQGLAADAAAAALESGRDPYHALNILESGTSMAKGLEYDLDVFSRFTDVQIPEVWDFGVKKDELDTLVRHASFPSPPNTTRLAETHIAKQIAILEDLQDLIRRIRLYPQCRSFLQAHSLDKLRAEAQGAPIVVLNTSVYRCDALIIDCHTGVTSLELPELTLSGIRQRIEDLRLPSRIPRTLEWLWNSAARCILDQLCFTSAMATKECPRVFWILPGAASNLPMHAAGRHMGGNTETVLDRVMSSYSSSVKSLISCRHRIPHFPKRQPESDVALLVSMEKTDRLQDLPSAPIEVDMVGRMCPSLGLRPIIHYSPLYPDIRQHFSDLKIFHFAGHGVLSSLSPQSSCLCLKDWVDNPITPQRLRDFRTPRNVPFLAYLSACSTGAIEQDNLVDEASHLIGACQLSSFRHVVGSLSPVADSQCVDIARIFYETLREEGVTDLAVCRGLHKSIMALRYGSRKIAQDTAQSDVDKVRDGRVPGGSILPSRPADEFSWIPYVHFGV